MPEKHVSSQENAIGEWKRKRRTRKSDHSDSKRASKPRGGLLFWGNGRGAANKGIRVDQSKVQCLQCTMIELEKRGWSEIPYQVKRNM